MEDSPSAALPLAAASESRFRRLLSLMDAAAQEFDALRRAGGGAALSHAERRVLALHYTPLERLAGDVLFPGPSEMVWASDDEDEGEDDAAGACDGSSLTSSVVSISQSASRSSLSTSPVPDAAAALAKCVCGKVDLPKEFMADYKSTGIALMSVDRLWGFLKAHGLPWRTLDREGAVVAVEKQLESETVFLAEHATAVAAAHAKSEIRAAKERAAAQLAREREEAAAAAAKMAPPTADDTTDTTTPPAAAKTAPPPAKAVAARATSKTAAATAAKTASSAKAVAGRVVTTKVTSKITTVTAASDDASTPRSASSSASRTPRSASTPRMGAARRATGGTTFARANSIGATAGPGTFGRRNTVRAAPAGGGGGANNGATNANADGASAGGSSSGRLHISKATPVISARPRPGVAARERAATTVAVAAKPKPAALHRRNSEASLVRAKASMDTGPTPLTRRSSEVLSRRPSAGAGNKRV